MRRPDIPLDVGGGGSHGENVSGVEMMDDGPFASATGKAPAGGAYVRQATVIEGGHARGERLGHGLLGGPHAKQGGFVTGGEERPFGLGGDFREGCGIARADFLHVHADGGTGNRGGGEAALVRDRPVPVCIRSRRAVGIGVVPGFRSAAELRGFDQGAACGGVLIGNARGRALVVAADDRHDDDVNRHEQNSGVGRSFLHDGRFIA